MTKHKPYEPECQNGTDYFWWLASRPDYVGGHSLGHELFDRLNSGSIRGVLAGQPGRRYTSRDAAMRDFLQAAAESNTANLEQLKAVRPRKTIALLGHGRSGKDTGCAYLAEITTLKNAGTTSKYLCEYMSQKLGLPVDEAYARRHESDEMRVKWYDGGNELREKGPTTLVKMALENGDITGGMRDLAEVVAARDEGVIDLLVWVENPRVPPDPTVKFGPEHCDITILNDGTLEEFYRRLERFARFAGLPMKSESTTIGKLSVSGPHIIHTELGTAFLDDKRVLLGEIQAGEVTVPPDFLDELARPQTHEDVAYLNKMTRSAVWVANWASTHLRDARWDVVSDMMKILESGVAGCLPPQLEPTCCAATS